VVRKTKHIDFEKTLGELEDIVTRMEKGEMTLEESLRSYERGVSLSRGCQKALEQAEQRIQILSEEEEQPILKPFEADND